jgi:hypothetical protein
MHTGQTAFLPTGARNMCARFSFCVLLIVVGIAQAATSDNSGCGREAMPGSFDGTQIWRVGNAVGFSTSKLNVDADGAPNSYRIDGKGLSFTCDGVSAVVNGQALTPKSDPQHWQHLCQEAWARARETADYSNVRIFGFLTDKRGIPVSQKAGDPLPNEAYVTTTTLTIPNTPDGTQRHWVDAVQIPYIVVSHSFAKASQLVPGDVAVVYRPRTGAIAFAVYADCCALGEASVRLHQDLGNNSIELEGGVERAKKRIEDRVVTIVFPGHHTNPSTDSAAWYRQIQDVSRDALAKWGGSNRLKACAQ